MTFYLTSIDTCSLSRNCFEIVKLKVFEVWPLPLTFRGHLGSKVFLTTRKLIHDFLSNFYWHFLSISYCFRDIRLRSMTYNKLIHNDRHLAITFSILSYSWLHVKVRLSQYIPNRGSGLEDVGTIMFSGLLMMMSIVDENQQVCSCSYTVVFAKLKNNVYNNRI